MYIYIMIKKIYQKNGILIVDDNKKLINNMKENYYIINNYSQDKSLETLKKDYYKSIGYKY